MTAMPVEAVLLSAVLAFPLLLGAGGCSSRGAPEGTAAASATPSASSPADAGTAAPQTGPVEFCEQRLERSITKLQCAKTVTTLEPLAALHDLEELEIEGLLVGGSLSPISGLTKLRKLSLKASDALPLAPLRTLTALETLSIYMRFPPDIEPLASLPALRVLELNQVKVSNIEPLGRILTLEELGLAFTSVEDLSPLATLPKLKSLRLSGSPVKDLSPLTRIASLEYVALLGVQVPAQQFAQLKSKRPKLEVAR